MDENRLGEHFGTFDGPELAPVLACELIEDGWRGLTADGEILNVRGGKPSDRLCINNRDGRPLGYHTVAKPKNRGTIDGYLFNYDLALRSYRANDLDAALIAINNAITIAPTTCAKFNRAFILLALGHWIEGFRVYAECEANPIFMRPRYREALELGLKPWQGEPIAGKRLLLVHDHGFGDTIMCLRYVAALAQRADVMLYVPPELRPLAAQCGPVTDCFEPADYFCPMLHLMRALEQTPQTVPTVRYLHADDFDPWLADGPKIGIAWSVGKHYDGDFQRAAPLELLVEQLRDRGRLYSVQQQGAEEARAAGVIVHDFADFSECAALMMRMDEIWTVDTAAVHLAGAIGHPNIHLLLSHWHSWRWLSPLYDNVTVHRQLTEGDWRSAFHADESREG